MIDKVQIRSFVKGGNHGQYLQALGLKVLVEQLLPRADVSHIDYENHFWKELKVQTVAGMLPKFLAMRFFWRKNFKFTPIEEIPDVSLYGSDMIWHMDSHLFPVDKKMFGEADYAKRKISYAPSAGYRIPEEPEWLEEMLDRFAAIGVRDRQTAHLVKDHSRKDPALVIDPCFYLLNSRYSEWFRDQSLEDFVAVYSPQAARLVRAFHHHLVLKKLPSFISKTKLLGYFPRGRFFQELGKQFDDPLWTVQQIARSRLLITSTFHGVMMGLMTQTPFIAVDSPNLHARLDSPIRSVFSSDRIMTLEALHAMKNKQLEALTDNSDFDVTFLDRYIDGSREWLRTVFFSIDS